MSESHEELVMALSELAAFETAYQVLAPLDAASRRRALAWLSDALGESKPLAQRASNNGTQPEAEPVARRGRPAKAGRKAVGRGRPRKVQQESESGARTYRRMPDADEVMAAYRQAGTINGLAEHFDVPVHTAYSWARRLRGQGHQIGRER
jgi:hypothetical protein